MVFLIFTHCTFFSDSIYKLLSVLKRVHATLCQCNMICIGMDAIGIRNVYINYFRFLFFFG